MTDLVAMLTATLWTVAIGLLSYRAGLRRGLALAEDATGWDWVQGSDDEAEGKDA